MKFITEANLRDLFRKEPFTTYKIGVGKRLTPGGRQFLSERRINIVDDVYGEKQTKNPIKEPKTKENMEIKNDLKQKTFYTRMKSIEVLFLVTAEEILSRDPFLAQRVMELSKEFSNIKNNLDKDEFQTYPCKECESIKADNINKDLEDCFEITGFHIQLERGRDIIILHRLRCALREIEPFVLELFQEDYEKDFLCKRVIGKVNQSINTLSQIICNIVGGEVCQKKS